jgi:phage FluMu gp28-like protein
MTSSLDYFLPYQQAWLNEPAPLAMGRKSRRVGWTYVSSYRAVERRVKGLCNLYFSSADLTSAREFIDYCKTWCEVFNAAAAESTETEVIADSELTSLVLTFGNGKKIVAGSSNPKFFRSKGGDADLDEFAFHRDGRELYKAAHATALFWRYQLRIWSTANGEGCYYNQLLKAQEAGTIKASVHTVTILDAVDQGLAEKVLKLKARDDKARQEFIDELHATCPDEDTWNQEYMCKPSTDATSLLSYDLIRSCEASPATAADPDGLTIFQSPEQLPSDGTMYAGYDVGRQRDLSVLWVIRKVGDVFRTVMLRELSKVDYTAQEGLLNVLLANRAIKRLCIDGTGIGDMLAERSRQKWGGRVENIHFTSAVKEELAMPLVRLFQDRLVRIPAVDAVREDLHKIRKIVTASNNVRFDAERDAGGHADRFWALALAYHAAGAAKIPLPPSRRQKPAGW